MTSVLSCGTVYNLGSPAASRAFSTECIHLATLRSTGDPLLLYPVAKEGHGIVEVWKWQTARHGDKNLRPRMAGGWGLTSPIAGGSYSEPDPDPDPAPTFPRTLYEQLLHQTQPAPNPQQAHLTTSQNASRA